MQGGEQGGRGREGIERGREEKGEMNSSGSPGNSAASTSLHSFLCWFNSNRRVWFHTGRTKPNIWVVLAVLPVHNQHVIESLPVGYLG